MIVVYLIIHHPVVHTVQQRLLLRFLPQSGGGLTVRVEQVFKSRIAGLLSPSNE